MCGIVGIVDAGGVSIQLYYAMYALQHRGQESAGISTFDGTSLCKFKGQGLVADVFSPSVLKDLKGTAGIGHVRYPTTGANLPENIQPLNFQFQDISSRSPTTGTWSIPASSGGYEQAGQIFTTTTDTEIIAKILIDEISASGCVEDAVHLCMKRMQGSYSVVIMIDGVIYGFRDPARHQAVLPREDRERVYRGLRECGDRCPERKVPPGCETRRTDPDGRRGCPVHADRGRRQACPLYLRVHLFCTG